MKEILLGLIGKLFKKNVVSFFLRLFWGLKKIDYIFIVHSRDYSDFFRKYPFLKFFPIVIVKIIIRFLLPFPVCKIKGLTDKNNNKIYGAFIAVPADAEFLLKNRKKALKKIINSIKLGINLGAEYFGLGALSASLSGNGIYLDFLKKKYNIVITTGHSYTCWNITQNVYDIINYFKKDISQLTLAIVGADGSIGSTCFDILKNDFKKIILIDKKYNEAKWKNKYLFYSNNIFDIDNADVIIAATNAPYSIINDDKFIKKNAILIDDAQPINISKNVLDKRHDLIVIEGGVSHHDKVSYKLNLNFVDKGDIFSCLAEVMILSISTKKEFAILGKTNPTLVNQLGILGENLGFRRAKFRSFGRSILE